jgi:hypothetical protein
VNTSFRRELDINEELLGYRLALACKVDVVMKPYSVELLSWWTFFSEINEIAKPDLLISQVSMLLRRSYLMYLNRMLSLIRVVVLHFCANSTSIQITCRCFRSTQVSTRYAHEDGDKSQFLYQAELIRSMKLRTPAQNSSLDHATPSLENNVQFRARMDSEAAKMFRDTEIVRGLLQHELLVFCSSTRYHVTF